MPKKKDYTGQKYAYLTAIEDAGMALSSYGRRRNVWKFQCDCGRFIITVPLHVYSGDTTSCGCKRRLPNNEAAVNRIIQRYQRIAKQNNREYSLTFEQFKNLTSKNCTYCNKKPLQESKSRTGLYIYNGIDRVDSTKGYNLDNCVSCCISCNRMKSDFSLETFKYQIKDIYNYLKLGDT